MDYNYMGIRLFFNIHVNQSTGRRGTYPLYKPHPPDPSPLL